MINTWYLVKIIDVGEETRKWRQVDTNKWEHFHKNPHTSAPIPLAAVSSAFQQGETVAQTRDRNSLDLEMNEKHQVQRHKPKISLLWYSAHEDNSLKEMTLTFLLITSLWEMSVNFNFS